MQHRAIEISDQRHFSTLYRFLAPAADLEQHVMYYWVLDLRAAAFRQEEYAEALLPNLYSSLVFSAGAPFEIYGQQQQLLHSCPHSTLIGYHAGTVIYRHLYNNYLVGIKFRPGGLSHLFRIRSADLACRAMPAADVMGDVHSVEQRLFEAAGPSAIREILDGVLRKYRDAARPLRSFDYVLRSFSPALLQRSRYQLQQLAAALFVSPRTLERYFAGAMDLSPKKCLTILRFRHALEHYAVHGYRADWEQLGYHDFSHFRREWRQYYPAKLSGFYTSPLPGSP